MAGVYFIIWIQTAGMYFLLALRIFRFSAYSRMNNEFVSLLKLFRGCKYILNGDSFFVFVKIDKGSANLVNDAAIVVDIT